MKKIISIFLVFCLLFSVCGCKKAPSEDTAAPLDIVTDTPQDEDTTPETETEQDPEQAPVQEQEIVQADKAEPCNLTLENTFSEYEVIVTLTNEETAKGKAYTAEDFKDYDIFYVIENDTYYGNPSMKDSYPEYQGRTTLFLYLNEPSKENVLETVKALEKDERVFAACPNPIKAKNSIIAYIKDEYKDKKFNEKFSDEAFSNLENLYDVRKNYNVYHVERVELLFDGYVEYHDTAEPKDAIAALPILMKDERFESVELKYFSKYFTGSIVITIRDPEIHEMQSVDSNYYDDKIPDIPGLEITGTRLHPWGHEVENNYPKPIKEEDKYNVDIIILLKAPTYQAMADALDFLKKDSHILDAHCWTDDSRK